MRTSRPEALVEAAPAGRHSRLRIGHVVAAAVIVVGVAAQIVRPLAPELGGVSDLGRWFDERHLADVAAYRNPRYAAALLSLALRVLIPCVVAFTPWGRRAVGRMVAAVGPRRPARAAAAVVLAVVIATDIAVLPLAFWSGFLHEGAYGFRTYGLGGWSADWLLAHVPAWLLVGALVSGGYTLARRLPRAWPCVGGLLGAALAVVLVFASPIVLEPLRHRTTELEPGALRTEVERLVELSGVHVSSIVVADASRRTTKQNAFVSGLGATKRIVLYDTLIAGQPPAEVGLVLAHELAHERHQDVLRGTLLAAAGVVATAYLLAAVVRQRRRRGRQASQDDPRAAAVVLAVVVLASTLSAPIANAVSRRAEAAADLGALHMTDDPETYIHKHLLLARANLSDPDPPIWVRWLWGTHPTSSQRLEMGQRWPVDWARAP